jgi:transposase-like protein
MPRNAVTHGPRHAIGCEPGLDHESALFRASLVGRPTIDIVRIRCPCRSVSGVRPAARRVGLGYSRVTSKPISAVSRISKLAGKSTRPGVHWCNECNKPFTVTVGTVMEDSKIHLNKWVLAYHLMSASKKGMSAHQLHRMLGVTYKSAWFLGTASARA